MTKVTEVSASFHNFNALSSRTFFVMSKRATSVVRVVPIGKREIGIARRGAQDAVKVV